MIVRFFAGARDATGESEWQPDCAPATVGALFDVLRGRYGERFAARLPGEGGGPQTLVLINGHNAAFAGGAGAPLRDGDEVAIFPPLGGG